MRISSAYNIVGPADINIAQILHLSKFFVLKRLVYIFIYKNSEPEANQKRSRKGIKWDDVQIYQKISEPKTNVQIEIHNYCSYMQKEGQTL